MGSQTPDLQPFARAFAEMWLFLVDLYKKTGHRLSHINIGGGLPGDYLPQTPMVDEIGKREREMLSAELDPHAVLKAAFSEAISAETAPLLEDLTIVLEPGRRIIGDTGLLVDPRLQYQGQARDGRHLASNGRGLFVDAFDKHL